MEHPVAMIRRTVGPLRTAAGFHDPAEATRLLMQAVLEDGIRTFLRCAAGRTADRPRSRRLWAEELAWFTSGDRSHPFTFEHICEALGIEAEPLRLRVLRAASLAAPPSYSRAAPRGTMP